ARWPRERGSRAHRPPRGADSNPGRPPREWEMGPPSVGLLFRSLPSIRLQREHRIKRAAQGLRDGAAAPAGEHHRIIPLDEGGLLLLDPDTHLLRQLSRLLGALAV